MNVLVVDDSAVMRAMIIRTLKLSGLPLEGVLQAGDGAAGLQVMRQEAVDLALVDLNMPVMSGEEMIQRARETPALAHIPIVIVSTDSSQQRADALKHPRTDFVHKPFTPELLRQTIVRLTGASQ